MRMMRVTEEGFCIGDQKTSFMVKHFTWACCGIEDTLDISMLLEGLLCFVFSVFVVSLHAHEFNTAQGEVW